MLSVAAGAASDASIVSVALGGTTCFIRLLNIPSISALNASKSVGAAPLAILPSSAGMLPLYTGAWGGQGAGIISCGVTTGNVEERVPLFGLEAVAGLSGTAVRAAQWKSVRGSPAGEFRGNHGLTTLSCTGGSGLTLTEIRFSQESNLIVIVKRGVYILNKMT